MSRLVNRKLVVVLTPRSDDDPAAVLKDIEKAFRPKEVEVVVQPAAESQDRTAGEGERTVETLSDDDAQEIVDMARRRLDERAGKAHSPEADRKPDPKTRKAIASKWRKKIAQFLNNILKKGYVLTIEAFFRAQS